VDAWATANTTGSSTSVTKAPAAAIAPNQWKSAANVFASDNSYATTTTYNYQQGYSNFGFNIPTNATIQGIRVTTEAKVLGASSPSVVLYPSSQGIYIGWSGDESDIDEQDTPSCSNNDRIDSSADGSRESVLFNLPSSIPNDSIITGVQIYTWDQGNPAGGTYQTFVRVNNMNIDSGVNIPTTSTSGCTQRVQTINIPDLVKTRNTNLEVGVVKLNSGGAGNNTVRVGAIRAVVTYASQTTGTVSVALSSDNGATWTASKNISVNSIESPANSTSDLWGRANWAPANFNDGNFTLKVQNGSTSGKQLFLDQATVIVFYTIPVSLPVACQLGVDLSWSGGTTPEKKTVPLY
jgi:hypothetical protein